jgi:hypothetical protein
MEDTYLSVCFISETSEWITIKFDIGFDTSVVQCNVTTNVPYAKPKPMSVNVLKYAPSCKKLIQVTV